MLRTWAVAALVVASALPVAAGADDFEEARRLHADRLFCLALPLAEKAAAADPGSPEKALLVGRCLLGLDRPLEVPKALEAARAKGSGDASLALLAGESWLAASQAAASAPGAAANVPAHVAKAAEQADSVLAKDPKNPDARLLKARCLASKIETDPAEIRKTLEGIAADAPKSLAALVELARWWSAAAEQDRKNAELWVSVEKSWKAALDLDPKCAEAAVGLARAHYRMGRGGKELRAEFMNAALIAPGARDPLAALVATYQRPDRVVPMLDEILAARPADAAVLLAKASLLARDGKSDRAAAILKEALAARPQDPRTALEASFILLNAGKVEEGVARMVAAIELCGGVLDRAVYDGTDFAAVRGAALSPAQRDLVWSSLWKAWPKESNAPCNAEIWWRDNGRDFGKSLEWCQRALEAQPGDPAILSDMGLLHAMEGPFSNPVKAEEFYRKAVAAAEERGLNDIEKSVGWRNAVENLVKLLLSQKRQKEVLDFAEKHLKKDPRYEAVKKAAAPTEAPPER